MSELDHWTQDRASVTLTRGRRDYRVLSSDGTRSTLRTGLTRAMARVAFIQERRRLEP